MECTIYVARYPISSHRGRLCQVAKGSPSRWGDECKSREVGKMSDMHLWMFREDQCSWRCRQGPRHEGLEGSLDMAGLGRNPRPLRGGSCECSLMVGCRGEFPAPISSGQTPTGAAGTGQALLRDQGLCYSGSCLPRSQAPGSFPLRHLRHSVLLREESRGGAAGAAGAPPWGKHASESQGWGWQGEGARAACQGGLPFSAEV